MLLAINRMISENDKCTTALRTEHDNVLFEALTDTQLKDIIIENKMDVLGVTIKDNSLLFKGCVKQADWDGLELENIPLRLLVADIRMFLVRVLELCDNVKLKRSESLENVTKISVDVAGNSILINNYVYDGVGEYGLPELRWQDQSITRVLKEEFAEQNFLEFTDNGVRITRIVFPLRENLRGDNWIIANICSVIYVWKAYIKGYISGYQSAKLAAKGNKFSRVNIEYLAESRDNSRITEANADGMLDFAFFEDIFAEHRGAEDFKYRSAYSTLSQLELLDSIFNV